jgi:UDP-N-acetylglucosamine:LPS N-acetylglucosamine transferase
VYQPKQVTCALLRPLKQLLDGGTRISIQSIWTSYFTTSECLAMGLPMIVISPIPGQEERNADFLLGNGAALKACDSGALNYRVSMLLNEPAHPEKLRIKARQLGKPEAARMVLDIVLHNKNS